jgi:hypothetical protein
VDGWMDGWMDGCGSVSVCVRARARVFGAMEDGERGWGERMGREDGESLARSDLGVIEGAESSGRGGAPTLSTFSPGAFIFDATRSAEGLRGTGISLRLRSKATTRIKG